VNERGRPSAWLDVEPRDSGGYVTLLLSGELDIASAPGLQRTVARLCALPSTRALTLDMSGLTFIDSTGLAAIVYASRVCEQRDCPLDVVRGPEAVQAVFAMTGLDRLLPFRAGGDGAPSSEGEGNARI
jgi:anti-sigma B factor antagonist